MVSEAFVPERVRVRMHKAGFGESVLVTIEYAQPDAHGRSERHVLFDLGSTRAPANGALSMAAIADLVAERTGGQLDVLVVTHRHKDHLSGFGDPQAAATITALAPRRVLRAWTEDPRLPDDATGPALVGVGAGSRRYAAQLAATQVAADRLRAASAGGHGAVQELHAAADAEVPNAAAIRTLDALSADGRGMYLHAGSPVRLARIVPGLRVTVLGPPTIEQFTAVTKQTARDPEYWMLQLHRTLGIAAPEAPLAAPGSAGAEVPPGPARWLVERLASHRTQSATRLVRALDDALNNTSLILLLEIGRLSLLFPGDAQVENWRYTLDRLVDDAELRRKLRDIDLYKVGHHGSRNATPRSLHALWAQRGPQTPRLTALMSTLSGVHGTTPATAVPRATLVAALKQVADLHSTEDLAEDEAFTEVVADVSGGPFKVG